MKVVLDIETIQAPRQEWARLAGKPGPPTEPLTAEEGLDLFSAALADEQRQAEDDLYAKSAFDGTYSRIVCIGMLEFSDQMEARSASSSLAQCPSIGSCGSSYEDSTMSPTIVGARSLLRCTRS